MQAGSRRHKQAGRQAGRPPHPAMSCPVALQCPQGECAASHIQLPTLLPTHPLTHPPHPAAPRCSVTGTVPPPYITSSGQCAPCQQANCTACDSDGSCSTCAEVRLAGVAHAQLRLAAELLGPGRMACRMASRMASREGSQDVLLCNCSKGRGACISSSAGARSFWATVGAFKNPCPCSLNGSCLPPPAYLPARLPACRGSAGRVAAALPAGWPTVRIARAAAAAASAACLGTSTRAASGASGGLLTEGGCWGELRASADSACWVHGGHMVTLTVPQLLVLLVLLLALLAGPASWPSQSQLTQPLCHTICPCVPTRSLQVPQELQRVLQLCLLHHLR